MSVDERVLHEVEQRVLWLATSIVQAASSRPDDGSGLKAGGHRASSASMVSVMTALWFAELTAQDRVSVKPHASPVLHAVNHLLGRLPASALATLREYGCCGRLRWSPCWTGTRTPVREQRRRAAAGGLPSRC